LKHRFYVKNKSFIYLDLNDIALVEEDGGMKVKLYLKGNPHPFRYEFNETVWKEFKDVMNLISSRREV
jgi:hypothetical protein